MTNSATSTDRNAPEGRPAFHAWHFFLLLSMAAATAAVVMSRETHPAALLLLSAAVIGAGVVGIALTRAVAGFFDRTPIEPLAVHARQELEREKALVLRSIKELEFDHAMGKVSDADFAAILARLRARALTLMRDLERTPDKAAADTGSRHPSTKGRSAVVSCAKCGTRNDSDARFCKNCGGALAVGSAS